jgi:hypothetical protein
VVTLFGACPISFCKMAFKEDAVGGAIGFAVRE